MAISTVIKIATLTTFVVVFAFGAFLLADYSSRAGTSGEILTDLNQADVPGLGQVAKGKSTVIFFYHPHCPCTLSAARCLERLSTKFTTAPRVVAFAFCPKNKPDDWIQSQTTQRLTCVTNAEILVDPDGEICRQFGVHISGHVLVYDAYGNAVFSGGVTPFRGHEGDSRAAVDLVDRVNTQAFGLARWPVFGCPIIEAGDSR